MKAAEALDDALRSFQTRWLDLLTRKKQNEKDDEFSADVLAGNLDILRLKGLLRTGFDELENLREGLSNIRAGIDLTSLQLQNQLYEKNYYEKEIEACYKFKSKFSDEQISLVPEGEFLETAPPELKGDEDTPHQRALNRLHHEEIWRQDTLALLDEAKNKANASEGEVTEWRNSLAGFAAELQKMAGAGTALRDRVGASSSPCINPEMVRLLPQPLYFIFMQLLATGQAYNLPVSASISGSVSQAEDLAEQAAKAGVCLERAVLTDVDVDMTRPAKQARYGVDPTALMDGDVHAVHPLAVVAKVGDSETPHIGVKFQYYPVLQLVTAQTTDSVDNPVLASLYAGDDGSVLPSEAAVLRAGGSPVWDSARLDRPYRWAQMLGGLDVMLAAVDAEEEAMPIEAVSGREDVVAVLRKQQRALSFLLLLRAAKPANDALRAQLASLQKLQIPEGLPEGIFPNGGPHAVLHGWAPVLAPAGGSPGLTVREGSANPAVGSGQDAPDPEDMGESSDEEGMVKQEEGDLSVIRLGNEEAGAGEGQLLVLGTKRFLLQARHDLLELLAVVTVPARYPREPSRVTLTELRRLSLEPNQATSLPSFGGRAGILAGTARIEEAVNEQLVERLQEGLLDKLLGLQICGVLRLLPGLQV
eukprot:jgi/Botrbrau1/14856/Bobra.0326s0007.1